jgi:hypothetical protein
MLLFYFDELCGAVELRARRNAETATCAAHVVGVVGRFCPLSEMQIHIYTHGCCGSHFIHVLMQLEWHWQFVDCEWDSCA